MHNYFSACQINKTKQKYANVYFFFSLKLSYHHHQSHFLSLISPTKKIIDGVVQNAIIIFFVSSSFSSFLKKFIFSFSMFIHRDRQNEITILYLKKCNYLIKLSKFRIFYFFYLLSLSGSTRYDPKPAQKINGSTQNLHDY